jgi:hypothetical protein
MVCDLPNEKAEDRDSGDATLASVLTVITRLRPGLEDITTALEDGGYSIPQLFEEMSNAFDPLLIALRCEIPQHEDLANLVIALEDLAGATDAAIKDLRWLRTRARRILSDPELRADVEAYWRGR